MKLETACTIEVESTCTKTRIQKRVLELRQLCMVALVAACDVKVLHCILRFTANYNHFLSCFPKDVCFEGLFLGFLLSLKLGGSSFSPLID